MRHRKLSGRHTEVMRRMSSSMLLSVFSLFLLTLYLIFSLSSLRNSCFLLLLFCPSACCCADGSPEHIHVSSKNISSLRLFTRRSVSALPVSPSRPPVITIVTYGSATPSPFTKRVFLSEFEQQSLLFFSDVYLCKDLCKCSFGGALCLHNCSAPLLLPAPSIPTLRLTRRTCEPARYQTRNSRSRWINMTERKFKLCGHCTPETAHCSGTLMRPQRLLAALCNQH